MPSFRILQVALLLSLAGQLHAATKAERKLLTFAVKAYPQLQREYLREVVQDTEKWAGRLCLSDQVDTLLCKWHRESSFDMTCVGDDGKSLGMVQTLAAYRPKLRQFWKAQGYRLGDDDDLDTQIAFGVAEFYIHLRRSKGNIYQAVRRYNGSGRGARKHAEKVFRSRAVIFGRPYVKGEAHDLRCGKVKVAKWTLP